MSEIEILELSQWLHDKGFEPDMWCDNDGEHFGRKQRYTTISELSLKEVTDRLYRKPYFTLNRALELLPAEIHSGDIIYERILDGTSFGYMADNNNLRLYSLIIGVGRTESVENDYHLAALRLLKQVVDAGYLKGESDE